MDPEAVISLIDSRWFRYEILKGSQYMKAEKPCSSSEPKFSSLRSILVRSQSEGMGSFNYGSFYPNSVLFTPQLNSINPSGGKSDSITQDKQQQQQQVQKPGQTTDPNYKEEAADDHEYTTLLERKKKTKSRRQHGHGMSKSLSELEFEELKGFMDLGFVFSEQDKQDSDLVEIIPGLQRLGEEREREGESEEEDDDDKMSCSSTGTATRRPYLSEAWEDLDTKANKIKKQKPTMVVNWEIPAVKSEVNMKDNLKLWAHTVASIVK